MSYIFPSDSVIPPPEVETTKEAVANFDAQKEPKVQQNLKGLKEQEELAAARTKDLKGSSTLKATRELIYQYNRVKRIQSTVGKGCQNVRNKGYKF